MDGLEFTSQVRTSKESPKSPGARIIMVSATQRYTGSRRRAIRSHRIHRQTNTTRDRFARITDISERPRPFVRLFSYVGPRRRRNLEVTLVRGVVRAISRKYSRITRPVSQAQQKAIAVRIHRGLPNATPSIRAPAFRAPNTDRRDQSRLIRVVAKNHPWKAPILTPEFGSPARRRSGQMKPLWLRIVVN